MSRRPGPAARGPACCACLLPLGLLLAGCSGNAFLIGESTNDGSDLGGERVPRPEPEESCPDLAELRSLDGACWPTRHVGRWHGFVTSSPQYHHRRAAAFEYPSDDTLLEVSEQGVATLTFSSKARPLPSGDAGLEPALDAGPHLDAGASVDAGDGAVDAGDERAPAERDPQDAGARLDGGVTEVGPALGLVLDFPYRLRELRMSGGPIGRRPADPRLDFFLLIAEPWSDFCTSSLGALDPELGPCVCTADACAPDPELLTVTLSLSADGQALRGSARSQGPDGVLAAGWEFIRESTP